MKVMVIGLLIALAITVVLVGSNIIIMLCINYLFGTQLDFTDSMSHLAMVFLLFVIGVYRIS